ncbi:MAG: hypothetical protein ABJN26_07450 [Stappiaceae bacterium]
MSDIDANDVRGSEIAPQKALLKMLVISTAGAILALAISALLA